MHMKGLCELSAHTRLQRIMMNCRKVATARSNPLGWLLTWLAGFGMLVAFDRSPGGAEQAAEVAC